VGTITGMLPHSSKSPAVLELQRATARTLRGTDKSSAVVCLKENSSEVRDPSNTTRLFSGLTDLMYGSSRDGGTNLAFFDRRMHGWSLDA
jgi:hypothetical protein